MSLTFYRDRPRPTLDDLAALKQDYADYHARRLSTHRAEEQFFRLKYRVPSPDGRSALYSPSGYQIVEDLINHIIAKTPQITIGRRNDDEAEVVRSEKLTRWVNGCWHALRLTKFLRQMIWFAAVRGVHVSRMFYDPGAWPAAPLPPEIPAEPADIDLLGPGELRSYLQDLRDYEDDRARYKDDLAEYKSYTEEHLPLYPQALDPMYCLWEPTPEPRRMIVAWDRTVDEIVQAHPATREALALVRPGTRLTWNEYWDDTYVAQWIQSTSAGVSRSTAVKWSREARKHKLGYFPFVVDGPWLTPLEDPDARYPSIYFAIKSMLQYESTLLTQMAWMIQVNGWAPLIIKTDRAEGQKPIIDMTPGKTNYIEVDEDVRYLEFSGQTMAVVGKLIDAVDQYVQKGTGLGDTMRGAPKGKSGYQQAQLQSMAQVALVPMEQVTTRALEQLTADALKIIRAHGEKITVLGVHGDVDQEQAVGPDDVRRFGRILVKLQTILPIDEGAKIANLTNMRKMGWISNLTAARLAGIENPEEEHARAVAEDIATMPEIKQAQALEYLQEHWPELFATVQQLLQGGGQGPAQPGVQVGPGGPGGAGGGAQPGQPGQPRPPAGAEGADQVDQVNRQAAQGGQVPKRLPGGEGQ